MTCLQRMVLFTALAAPGWSADLTGTWTGSMVLSDGNQGPARLHLKQSGVELSGSAGPSEDQQFPISRGRVDGDQVHIESRPGAAILGLSMKLEGGKLTGEVSEDGRRIGTVSLEKAMCSFGQAVPLETVAETTANVSLGDLNGDGNLDIVLAKGRHWPLADVVLFGDGRGHFTPGPPLPNHPDRSYSAPLADLNGDGTLDMVISNDQPDPKLVLLNDGKGRFTLAGTFGDPNWPTRNVVLADLNGDGFPDIAVANRPGPSYVCFNDGKAHFTCRALGPETSATILAGDMDGDGSQDLVVACRDDCQSVVYMNDGTGHFPAKRPFGPARASTRAMAIADFNGDGRLDIAACDESDGLFVYFNLGKGNFGPGIKIAGREALPYSMMAADLNQDGKPDIVVGYVNAPGAIYFNLGNGREYQRVPFGDGEGAIYGLAAGDLNGDGYPDIVAARSGAPSVVYFSH